MCIRDSFAGGGLIVNENGIIEAVGKKVNTNNIPSREKYIDLKGIHIMKELSIKIRELFAGPGDISIFH